MVWTVENCSQFQDLALSFNSGLEQVWIIPDLDFLAKKVKVVLDFFLNHMGAYENLENKIKIICKGDHWTFWSLYFCWAV